MTVLDALETLTVFAQAAQSSGVVPVGPWNLALTTLVLGSQTVQASGLLQPKEPVEISEIGDDFDAAVERMRAALALPPGGA